MISKEDLAYLRRYFRITGDGNVIGDGSEATVIKQRAGPYSLQIGQLKVTLSSEEARRYLPPSEVMVPFHVPFPQNQAFVGRTQDLTALHELLQGQGPVAIQPTGLSGMGGIGKTQLAVEYAYRYRGSYPGGIFWIDATQSWAQGLGRLALTLGLTSADATQDTRVRAMWQYLQEHPSALVIFDDVTDPAALNRPLLPGLVPAALGCHLLFTTRRRDVGLFRAYDLVVLAEPAALRLLLRHKTRHSLLDKEHPDHHWARVICAILGYLPLALELAAAFLGKHPEIALQDYRRRLLAEGALDTVDETRLQPEALPTRHVAAVKATFQTSWNTLSAEAQHVMRSAGQLETLEALPVARLGMVSGFPHHPQAVGHPAPIRRWITELVDASLMERLKVDAVRLHPLIHAYAERQVPPAEVDGFRRVLAGNVESALEAFPQLQQQVAARGITAVLTDVRVGLTLAGQSAELRSYLQALEQVLDREAHTLRAWDPSKTPAFFAQQIAIRSARLGRERLQRQATAALETLKRPYLRLRWRIGPESPALLRSLNTHKAKINAVLFTPDGDRVLSASDDTTIRVWNWRTGQVLQTLVGHEGAVTDLQLLSDGLRLLSAAEDGRVRAWDFRTGQNLATYVNLDIPVSALAVNEQQEQLALAAAGRILILDLETRRLIQDWEAHGDTITRLLWNEEQRCLLSASLDGTVKIWDVKRHAPNRPGLITTLDAHPLGVNDIALGPEAEKLLSAGNDHTVKIWTLTNGRRIQTLEGHRYGVTALAMAHKGRWALSTSADHTIGVWDLTLGHRIAALVDHTLPVTALACSSDGRYAVSGAGDKTLKVWDLTEVAGSQTRGAVGALAAEPGHHAAVSALTVMPDRRCLLSAAEDGRLATHDLATGALQEELTIGTPGVNTCAYLSGSKSVLVAANNATLRIVDWETHKIRHTLEGHLNVVWTVAVTSEGRFAVSGSEDLSLKVWNLESGEEICSLMGHTGGVYAVTVLPGDRQVLSGAADGTVRLWNLDTCEERAVLAGHSDEVWAVVGWGRKHALSGAGDGTINVWDLERGDVVHVLSKHTEGVTALSVWPQAQYAISGGQDNTLRLWNLRRSTQEALFVGDGSFLSLVALHLNDTPWLFVGDEGGAIWAFELIT
jgi:WD40 repeat protein